MTEPFAKFNPTIRRRVYVVGDPSHVEMIARTLKAHYFLTVSPFRDAPADFTADDTFYVLAVTDFSSSSRMQIAARAFGRVTSTFAYKLVYALAPDLLTTEQLLFAQEIGARYVAQGVRRNEELKDYLKSLVMEAHKAGSLEEIEREMDDATRKHDMNTLRALVARLKESEAEGEVVSRLLVVAHQRLGDMRMTEFYLKQLLRANPQNLWAANTLGKMLLASGRITEGIDVLERLSRFHDLNGERILELGNAYAASGEGERAEQLYKKGDVLADGEDPRYKVGMAKVKLLANDLANALKLAGKDGFSEELVRFLNMRAIVAIRRGRFSDGMIYYSQAEQGTRDAVTKAKLFFNMGLAYVKTANLTQAQHCFGESLKFGGAKFRRADGPLAVVNTILKSRDKDGTKSKSASELIDVEFETLF